MQLSASGAFVMPLRLIAGVAISALGEDLVLVRGVRNLAQARGSPKVLFWRKADAGGGPIVAESGMATFRSWIAMTQNIGSDMKIGQQATTDVKSSSIAS